MARFLDTLVSDLVNFVKPILLGVWLFAGGTTLVAVAALIAKLMLAQPEEGMNAFYAIMAFQVPSLAEPIQQVVMTFNWASLAALAIFSGYLAASYFITASDRSERGVIVMFPSSNEDGGTHQQAANG